MILDENENKVVYLAAPYSTPDPYIQRVRFWKTCEVQAQLMTAGITVFSPLANSIPAVEFGNLQLDHAVFMKFDKVILRRCDELLVLGLDGWRESKGVQEEISEAIALCKPVLVLLEEDFNYLPEVQEKCNVFGCSKIFPYRK